jgi:hypothetical protein
MFENKKHFLFAFLLAAASSCACHAVDLSTTEIIDINGRVEVKKGQTEEFKKLNKNLKLSGSLKRLDGGDKVRTFTSSTAEMALKETCILAVKEQSLFEVPQTLGKEAITQLKAQQGALLFKVISGSNFEVKTADVIAGVKGTLFEMDIVDGFRTMLEIPGMQFGTAVSGGTIVNVYRGEVDLTHAVTGESVKLKEGQSINVFNRSALKYLQGFYRNGFGNINPIKNVREFLQNSFGSNATALLDIAPQIGPIKGFAGVGSINPLRGTRAEKYNILFSSAPKNIIRDLQIGNGFSVGESIEILEGLQDEKFHADFSSYSPNKRSFRVNDRNFTEVYLGNQAFAACKSWAGDRNATIEPTEEGIFLDDGNGLFRCIQYKGNSINLDFVVSFQKNADRWVTITNVIKGELFGRFPGELDYFKIPAGTASYIFDPTIAKGQWVKAEANSPDSSAMKYEFKVSKKINENRKKVDQKNRRKKIETGKKLLRKFGF